MSVHGEVAGRPADPAMRPAADTRTTDVVREPVLRAAHLTRRFGDRTAVDDVSFEIRPGETYGLLGPNGAGKTTTIRMVCGLLHRDGGELTVDGLPQSERTTETKAQIGYVPQDVALYPDLTARENLRFFGRLYRLRRRLLAERIDEVLDLTGLADRAGDRVESFSGGMRRRLNIGAALLHHPTLLVLDEPTVGVDPQSRHAILDAVHNFGTSGTAVLYTTHYMEEAQRLCDRIGIMDRGRLVAEGTHRELVSQMDEHDHIVLVAVGDLEPLRASLAGLSGVASATATGGQLQVLATDARNLLPRVLELASDAGVEVSSVEVTEPDLEAVFLHLTGTALRE
jgi:ABC-2 type transport system ATP-binding protein